MIHGFVCTERVLKKNELKNYRFAVTLLFRAIQYEKQHRLLYTSPRHFQRLIFIGIERLTALKKKVIALLQTNQFLANLLCLILEVFKAPARSYYNH